MKWEERGIPNKKKIYKADISLKIHPLASFPSPTCMLKTRLKKKMKNKTQYLPPLCWTKAIGSAVSVIIRRVDVDKNCKGLTTVVLDNFSNGTAADSTICKIKEID